jgi:hypothetical protein
LGIPRQERFLEVLNPHDCIRPEQGSKQDSGSPGTGTRQSSTGDFLFESNVDFFRQPLFPFLFPFLFFFFFSYYRNETAGERNKEARGE